MLQPTIKHKPIYHDNYPLLKPMFKYGVLSGILVGFFLESIVLGMAVAVLCWVTGLSWRRNELPALVFCFFYQWLAIVPGYIYFYFMGFYPQHTLYGQIEMAVIYSLLGLLSLAIGSYLALKKVVISKDTSEKRGYDTKRLFWLVIFIFSVNWGFEIGTLTLHVKIAQIVYNLLLFRYLFLFLLFYVVIKRQQGYSYIFFSTLYVLIPGLLTGHSNFKEVFFIIGIIFLGQWQPWSKDKKDKVRNWQILVVTFILGGLLIAMGLFWTGGLKHSWRSALHSGEITGSVVEKVSQFDRFVNHAYDTFDLEVGAENLTARLASAVAYFSLTIDNVPDIYPYTNGDFTLKALKHIVTPRILFPEKEKYFSDSWIVRKYAGIYVAGEDQNTSVGMGYMAEFYIDFGFPLMLVPLIIYGMAAGWMYRVLVYLSPSKAIAISLGSILFFQHLSVYEGTFLKSLGGLVQAFILFSVIVYLFGASFQAFLIKKKLRQVRRVDVMGLNAIHQNINGMSRKSQ